MDFQRSKKKYYKMFKYLLWVVIIGECLVMMRVIPWLSPDSQGYLNLAHSLSSGTFGGIEPDAIRSPGYPVFLWIFVELLHLPLIAIVIVQMALYLFSIYLIQKLLEDHHINPLWFLGSLIVYPAAAAYSVPILSEAITIAIVSGIVYLLSRPNKPSNLLLMASSFLAAIAVLVRPSTIGLPVIVCIIGYFRLKAIKPVLLSLLIGILVLMPFSIRNLIVFKRFTPMPVASAIWQSLYAASWEGELNSLDIVSIGTGNYTNAVYQSGILQEFEKINLSFGAPSDIISFSPGAYPTTSLQIASSSAFREAALERIQKNPASYAWHVMGGWWRLWNTKNYPDSLPQMFGLILMITSALICILGYIGGIYYLRKSFDPLLAAFFILLYFPLVHCWLHTEARYTAPARLLLVLFASVVIDKVFELGTNLRNRKLLRSQK